MARRPEGLGGRVGAALSLGFLGHRDDDFAQPRVTGVGLVAFVPDHDFAGFRGGEGQR